jgi:hypothetical protein
MNHVTYVRGHVMQYLKRLRIYLSCNGEIEAVRRLSGREGVATATRIADYVLQELGHESHGRRSSGEPALGERTATQRAAKRVIDEGVRE